ncbi:hypothetical protein DFJ77DRAFT_469193 [Powellomyces hirtus]|nr:hypothetical protein DFJ77DRAFT_469193 [Powellomyces hirtus]
MNEFEKAGRAKGKMVVPFESLFLLVESAAKILFVGIPSEWSLTTAGIRRWKYLALSKSSWGKVLVIYTFVYVPFLMNKK